MKKAAEYIGVAILIMLMIASALTYLAPHLGWRVDALSSGSMEPQLKVGDLVVAWPVKPETIVVGDVITLRPVSAGQDMITHRVFSIGQGSSLSFKTKGDANSIPDPISVPAQNILGKVCFHVPYLGYVTEFLKTKYGFLLALVVPSLAVIALYVRTVWRVLTRAR
jgi:signal peptidase